MTKTRGSCEDSGCVWWSFEFAGAFETRNQNATDLHTIRWACLILHFMIWYIC